jgi:uncharacterized repeat protein (TIGR01451 family)
MPKVAYKIVFAALIAAFVPVFTLFISVTVGEPVNRSKEITLKFDQSSLQIVKESGRDRVVLDLPLCKYPADPAGAPQLPARFARIVVPQGAKFEKVSVTNCQTRTLPGTFEPDFVKPACRPGQEVPASGPDQKIYGGQKPYPAEKVEFLRSGLMRGYTIFFFRVNPVQYLTQTKQLQFHIQITLRIEYTIEQGKKSVLKPRGASNEFRQMLLRYVENPQEIGTSESGESEKTDEKPGTADEPLAAGGQVDYLIICSNVFKSEFQRLANWKKKKGVPAKVVTTEEDIDPYYTGEDKQERIKRCIIDYVNNNGTVYVLLGGDIDTIPQRRCYGEVSTETDTTIPCDLYYAGLDDIYWDDDNDGLCGETDSHGDTVDMEPDVFIGRCSCGTVGEAQAFVDKVLEYEKESSSVNFGKDILLAGVKAWGWFDQSGGYHPDSESYQAGWKSDAEVWTMRIYNDCVAPFLSLNPTEYFDTTTGVTLTQDDLKVRIDEGYGLLNMDTHGNVQIWAMESGYSYSTSYALNQTNDKQCSIIYTTACITNAFDDALTCLGEGFTRNPDGGAVAYIGSSRYGWGSPGSYYGEYSFRYNRSFYTKMFGEKLYNHLGEAFTEHKWDNADLCGQYNPYRWLQFSINFLGDPEMPVWTDNPQTMSVIYPAEIALGSQTIYIKGASNSHVCLWKITGETDEVYVRGDADENGIYSALISPATTGVIWLTVTNHNFYPFEGDIIVANNPSLHITTVALPDGETGRFYSAVLEAGGGAPPYQWTLVSGSLPSGLTLDPAGTVSGTPTTLQTSDFTVQARDADSNIVAREFTIRISLDVPQLNDLPVPECDGNYTASWTGSDIPTHYELQESSGFWTEIKDDAESGTGQWTVQGFSISSSRCNSWSKSFYGGTGNNINNALTYARAITVGGTTTVSFWCWYNVELNYDYAYFEISTNGGATWKKLKSYTGTSDVWIRETFSLASYAGTSIQMRFRYETDYSVLREGFYMDDFEVTNLSTYEWVTLSSYITAKSYDVRGRIPGTYYYRVRAFVGADASEWSEIKSVTVLLDSLFIGFSVNKAEARPYEELTYSFEYDNDSAGNITSLVMEAPVPANTTYIADSAENHNSPHTGAGVTVSYYDGALWHNSLWDNANPSAVKRVKWTFSIPAGPDSGGDTEGVCDGVPPDTDAGEVKFKVMINGTLADTEIPAQGTAQWGSSGSSLSEEVRTKVTRAYGMNMTSVPSNQSGDSRSQVTYNFTIKNVANCSDTLVFTLTGESWLTTLDNISGNQLNLDAGASYSFSVIVDVPGSAVNGSTDSFTLEIRNQDGSGTEDNWPQSGNDTLSYTLTTTARAPHILLVVSSPKASENPPYPRANLLEEITYTVSYINDGAVSATDVALVNAIPASTKYVKGSAAAAPHAGSVTIEYYLPASGWTSAEPDENTCELVTRIQFTFDAPVGVGAAGSITFKVRIE